MAHGGLWGYLKHGGPIPAKGDWSSHQSLTCEVEKKRQAPTDLHFLTLPDRSDQSPKSGAQQGSGAMCRISNVRVVLSRGYPNLRLTCPNTTQAPVTQPAGKTRKVKRAVGGRDGGAGAGRDSGVSV